MLEGCGWKPYFVEGDEPMKVHRALADTLDTVTENPRHPQARPRDRRHDPSDLPDDRAAHPEGLDRSEERGRQSRSRAASARIRCR